MRPYNRTFFFLFILIVYSCQQSGSPSQTAGNTSAQQEGNIEALDGETLAKIHCASCHTYTEPGLLDKATWNDYVLPRMGYMLGIYPYDTIRQSLIGNSKEAEILAAKNIYPEKPQLPDSVWNKIQDFYLSKAPEKLDLPSTAPIATNLNLFKPRFSDYYISPPSSTMVEIVDGLGFIVGDANSESLYFFNSQRELIRQAKVSEGAVDYRETESEIWITVMGSFSPTDEQKGMILNLPKSPQAKLRKAIENLQRPVDAQYADLNSDGLEDIVICEFAKWTGALAWWEYLNTGKYKKHILRDKPGATKSYIQDFNGDGQLDIIALMAQGDEGIFMYFNEGNGEFREEKVLDFPSTYGSSYFNLFDWNKDGLVDIIYTNGDNADYPPVLKPYHGIRIFINKGENSFEEEFFYPLNGAYKAIPADFDEDGDYDIAAISFFPDFENRQEESFVYLENQGSNQFIPQTFNGVKSGRWIVMDAGDIDGDQDLDLILGSLTFEVVGREDIVNGWVKNGNPFVVLENTTR